MMDFLSALPFEWAQFSFMRNALAAIVLLAPLYGTLGTMVVDSRMAFFSDSLGHGALTGVAIGVLLGLEAPLLSMIGFGIVFAVLLVIVKHKGAASADTTIGVFSSTAVALGIMILSLRGGFAKYSKYLIGDILAVEPADIISLLVVLAIVAVYWLFMYNRLLIAGLNSAFARSRGIRPVIVEISFACVVALVVTVSIQWVGILLINAMLVLPAAAARNISRNVRGYHLFSILFALVCGAAGLLLSFEWGTASGATIVVLLAVVYAVTLAFRRR